MPITLSLHAEQSLTSSIYKALQLRIDCFGVLGGLPAQWRGV